MIWTNQGAKIARQKKENCNSRTILCPASLEVAISVNNSGYGAMNGFASMIAKRFNETTDLELDS